MSWPAKELTDLAATQRKKGQHEEVLASALAATKANPDSANGWWRFTQCCPALERTVEQASHFGRGWIELGNARLKPGDEEKALETLETRTGGGTQLSRRDAWADRHLQQTPRVPHTATEEQRSATSVTRTKVMGWLSATGGVTRTVASPADLTSGSSTVLR
jgi:hypothetical protein